MADVTVDKLVRQEWERLAGPDSRLPDVSAATAEIERHFRENYPILLDGALPLRSDQGHFIRQARESLITGRIDPDRLPAAILRETLDAITAVPAPATRAGLTAIGPGNARVWWDKSLLDNLDDVLADLDRPRPSLRFFDVTGLDPDGGRWHEMFDIDVALDEEGRTIDKVRPEREYVVDLGYCHADGRFLRLARTNTAGIPREGRGSGENTDATVRSNLRPRARTADSIVVPDSRAREWAEARPDHPDRDVDSEMLMHMLYRAFLLEGPRSLRRAPRPLRRDPELLKREYAQRVRTRERKASRLKVKKAAPTFLVARLDARPKTRPAAAPVSGVASLPAPSRLSRPLAVLAGSELSSSRFTMYRDVVLFVRSGRYFDAVAGGAKALVDAIRKEDTLVRAVPAEADNSLELLAASPVFDAARDLRRRLSGIAGAENAVTMTETSVLIPADNAEQRNETKKRSDRLKDFGGSEARRFAKAGVRVTRVSLMLEGRMRPGARLKVAGKLVYADADGCFRLECILTGRRASIPMTAGTSIEGEVRSQVTIDWEKRSSKVKKVSLA